MRRADLSRDIAELHKRIKICKEYKKKLHEHHSHLRNKLSKGELQFHEYQKHVNDKLNGKTIHEWIHRYNQYIEHYEKNIRELEHKKKKKTKRTVWFWVSIIFFLVLIAFSYSNFPSRFTGFFIQEQIKEIQNFNQTLNIETSNPGGYNIQLEQGILDSLKISGAIETGDNQNISVKIYLDDLLILDSSKTDNFEINESYSGNNLEHFKSMCSKK